MKLLQRSQPLVPAYLLFSETFEIILSAFESVFPCHCFGISDVSISWIFFHEPREKWLGRHDKSQFLEVTVWLQVPRSVRRKSPDIVVT